MKTIKYIGIAGTFASGKDTLGQYLAKKYNYALASSSDVVRKFSVERHGSIERPYLQETAEYYRKKFGPDFFMRELLKNANKNGLIITGLRAVGEAKFIKDKKGILVFVDAPQKLRYERMVERHRDAESAVSYDVFVQREKAEWHIGDDLADFSFKNLKEMADFRVNNTVDTVGFFDLADKILDT